MCLRTASTRACEICGVEVTWEEAINSELDLAPDNFESLNDDPPVKPLPNGQYPVAMPGLMKAF